MEYMMEVPKKKRRGLFGIPWLAIIGIALTALYFVYPPFKDVVNPLVDKLKALFKKKPQQVATTQTQQPVAAQKDTSHEISTGE